MATIPHWRATFKGSFRVSANAEPFEYWNTSVALDSGGALTTASAQSIANDLAADFVAFIQTPSAYFSVNTFFDEVRLDHVGSNGRIDQDAVFGRPAGNTPVGGKSQAILPPSCALVLTLDTGRRGRSRFGRMYLPILSTGMGNDGRIPANQQTEILAAARTFIKNVSNAPGIDGSFGVAVSSKAGAGSVVPVQAIRLGRVVDTMRSRRRSLDESYAVATL